MIHQKQPTALFVADSHFHLAPSQVELHRVDRFLAFLEMARAVDHLFLVGDLFDFWFDYPHFRLRGYDEILHGLDGVRDAGVKIHFIGGNHDIWAAGYFHQRYGTDPGGGPVTQRLGDLTILASHGDGLLAYDWAYNAFRNMVRTRAGIVLAKSLHPELLYRFSTWLSGHSRAATRDEAAAIETKAATWLAQQDHAPWDLMVIGHLHHAHVTTSGTRRLACLAGWFDTLGYGLLQDGAFSLLDFENDPTPEL